MPCERNPTKPVKGFVGFLFNIGYLLGVSRALDQAFILGVAFTQQAVVSLTVVEDVDGCLQVAVAMVDDDVVGALVTIHVAGNQALDDVLEQQFAGAVFLLVKLDAVVLAHCDEIFHHLVGHDKALVKVL